MVILKRCCSLIFSTKIRVFKCFYIFQRFFSLKNAFVYIWANFIDVTLTSVPWINHYTFSVAPSVANYNIPAPPLVLYNIVLLTVITHWVFLGTLHLWNIKVTLKKIGLIHKLLKVSWVLSHQMNWPKFSNLKKLVCENLVT